MIITEQDRIDTIKECVNEATKLISEAAVHARHLKYGYLFQKLFDIRIELHELHILPREEHEQ